MLLVFSQPLSHIGAEAGQAASPQVCKVSTFLLPLPALCDTSWLLQKAFSCCLNGRVATRAGHTAGSSTHELVSLWVLVAKYIWATDSRVGREPLECSAQGAGATFKPIFHHEGRDKSQTMNKKNWRSELFRVHYHRTSSSIHPGRLEFMLQMLPAMCNKLAVKTLN